MPKTKIELDDPVYTLREAAAAFKLDLAFVKEAIARQSLKASRLSERRIRIKQSDLYDWLESHATK
jgi:excisionase family DNA binding protein